MPFPATFTAEELKSGARMIVHPISGKSLSELRYCEFRKAFFRSVPRSGWDQDPDEIFEPVIPIPASDVTEGSDLPTTWVFDPYTGERLILGY
jgi:hypothetical protein